jgi:histidinol-phosphate/aromatic aminotransferase/cobyric acid decarboxylase-like protein
MKEYHPPLGDRSGLRFDFNENTFACSPRVLEALGRISRGDLTRYPEREPVERAVAEASGLKPQQLLLTNGVDEAIHLLCQTYLDAGTEILLPVPTYTMYEVYASGTPAQIIHIPADEGFRFPVASAAQCHHPGDAPHRHRQSQQSHRPGRPSRRSAAHRRCRSTCRRARGRGVFPFLRRNAIDLVGRGQM